MEKQHLSYSDVEQLVGTIRDQIVSGDWLPTMIVGICRGGLIPATLLSHQLGVPMRVVHVSLREGQSQRESANWIADMVKAGHRLLLVDDINDSGATFDWIDRDWHHQCALAGVSDQQRINTRWAALLTKITSNVMVDYSGRALDLSQQHIWWEFPWERTTT